LGRARGLRPRAGIAFWSGEARHPLGWVWRLDESHGIFFTVFGLYPMAAF